MSWKMRVSIAFLAATCLFACAGYVYEIGRYPRYVDFDSATLGISSTTCRITSSATPSLLQFGTRTVPNRSGTGFVGRPPPSADASLSWLQRAFRIAPEHVGLLIHGAASFFGLACAIVAAWGSPTREAGA